MTEEKEEKYWKTILAFSALIFAIYPIGKDWITNQNDTFKALIFTLTFSGLLFLILKEGLNKEKDFRGLVVSVINVLGIFMVLVFSVGVINVILPTIVSFLIELPLLIKGIITIALCGFLILMRSGRMGLNI